MHEGCEWTVLWRRCTNGRWTDEKTLDIVRHWGKKCKSKPQCGTISHGDGSPLKKEIVTVGKDVEKWGSAYSSGGNVNGAARVETSLAGPWKANRVTTQPSNINIPQRTENISSYKPVRCCSQWHYSQWPKDGPNADVADWWVDRQNTVCSCRGTLFSHRKEWLIHATVWKNFKTIMPSERSQTQRSPLGWSTSMQCPEKAHPEGQKVD